MRRDDRLTRYSPGFKQTLLVEALKYISRFSGTTCVLGYGGEGLRKGSLRASFCEDVVLLRSVGLRPVVVHGAVPPEEGMPPVDPDVLEMVLTGRITGDLVALLNRGGGQRGGHLRQGRAAAPRRAHAQSTPRLRPSGWARSAR